MIDLSFVSALFWKPTDGNDWSEKDDLCTSDKLDLFFHRFPHTD
jgi:hypothetical protein